jgi:hypothetical protein
MINPRDDSDRLKPCANCGSDGEVDQTQDGGYFIQCTNALCGMSTVLMYACGDDPVPILMEKWNRRASPQSPSGQQAEPLNPVEPGALAASIVELEAWLETDGCEPLTPSEGESIHLVLHELKRLRAAPSEPTELPPLPAFSYFLENSTHDMQRDAIRAYAKAYARLALSRSEQTRAAASLQETK